MTRAFRLSLRCIVIRQALSKEVPNWGPRLHNHSTVHVPAGNPSLVVTCDSTNFPANANAVNQLTKEQIARLSIFFNDDFGIQAADCGWLVVCVQKWAHVRPTMALHRECRPTTTKRLVALKDVNQLL